MNSTPSTPRPRRLAATLLALGAVVALMHALLWQGMTDSWAAASAPARHAPALQVRTVAASPPAPVIEAPAPVAKPAPALPKRATNQVAERTAAEAPTLAPQPSAEPVLVAAALPASSTLELTPIATAPPPDDVPVYRTTMPPAMTLSYDMRRGAIGGNGELTWRPTAAGYEAKLEGRVAGFPILTWASQGAFDAAGIAPLRFTDQRRGKAALAANFQRQPGKISYSGNAAEYPLLRGSQDRLSWMIQIAAIASADPKQVAPGGRITMFVSGARGDADAWSFKVQGTEEVSMGSERVQAVKLLREPRKEHDTRVEVWLAPSLHHLPVRARLTSEGSTLELNLQAAQPAT